MPEQQRRAILTTLSASLLPIAATWSIGPANAQDRAQPVEYLAEYEVRYKGRRVARAVFSLTDEDGSYIFESSTQARGLLRLASPNPAIEHSRFTVEGSAIVPLDFRFEDGSRKGEDNYSIDFAGDDGMIRIDGPNGQLAIPVEAGLLDRGSLQVALMQDLGACRTPTTYRFVDDDGVREYEYARLEDRTTETGIGEIRTLRLSQQREGSSRTTILWLAPELAYLPVRIEQIRNGETETVFTLEDVSGIEETGPACSGFR